MNQYELDELASLRRRISALEAQSSPGRNPWLDSITTPSGTLGVSSTGVNTATAVELGAYATGNRFAFIDLHGDDTYSDFSLRLFRDNTGANATSQLTHRGIGDVAFNNLEAAAHVWRQNGAERMRLTNNFLTFGAGDTDTGFQWNRDGYLALVANGATMLGAIASGSSPGVYVDGASANNAGSLNWGLRFGGEGAGEGIASQRGTSGGNQYGLDFYTGGGRRMYLTSGGQLGLGTIPSYVLQLASDSAAKPGTSTWTVISDVRTKAHVHEITLGLDYLRKLPPIVAFQYNGQANTPDGEQHLGFLAHQIKASNPDMYHGVQGKLNPTDKQETEIGAINLHPALMALIQAVLELDLRTKKE